MADPKPLPLIELNTWPSMPAPWSSSDPGETWIIGDFFALLQKEPESVGAILQRHAGHGEMPTAMHYFYALTVFYRRDRNPHGPTSRPVLTLALEQSDAGLFAAQMGAPPGPATVSRKGPVILGAFTGEGRLNLGEYTAGLHAVDARDTLLARAAGFGITGTPRLVGDIQAAYGHPDTGVPKGKSKAGCTGVLAVLMVLLVVAVAVVWPR